MLFQEMDYKCKALQPMPTWDNLHSTKLECFILCPRKYLYEHIFGWEPEGVDLPMHFGSSWHEAMRYLLRNTSGTKEGRVCDAFDVFKSVWRQKVAEADDDPKNARSSGAALLGLHDYLTTFPEEDFEVLYTEVFGSLPMTPDRFICFKIDTVVRGPEGVYALEHKTTSMESQMWKDSWTLSMQLHTYMHALYTVYGDETYGAKINAGIFRKKGNLFLRIPIRRSFKQMSEWIWQVEYYLMLLEWSHNKLAVATQDDEILEAFPKNPGNCTKWNKICPYHAFCSADSWTNPLCYLPGPQPGFIIRFWDPLEEYKKTANFHIEEGRIEPYGPRATNADEAH